MARYTVQGVRMAKRNVSRWFAGTDTRVFLPLKGRGIPVSAAEEQAIKAGSEPYIAKSHDRFYTRLVLLIASVIVVVTLIYLAKARYPALDNAGVDDLAYFIYAMAGLLMFYEGWRWERSIFDLRDGIALSLADRRGQPLVPIVDRAEPDYRQLSATATILAGALVLWPLVSFAAGARKVAPIVAVIGDGVVGILIGSMIGIPLFAALYLWRRRVDAAAEDGADG